MKFITSLRSEGLSAFCHELSKQLNVPASKIKHAIARTCGHSHVSSFVSEIDAADVTKLQDDFRLSESGWQSVLDRFSDCKEPRAPFFIATKKVLSIICQCINAQNSGHGVGFSTRDVLALTKPKLLIFASLSLYISSESHDVKADIKEFIGYLPGFKFDDAIALISVGHEPVIAQVICEHLGYLTMDIMNSVQNFSSQILEQHYDLDN